MASSHNDYWNLAQAGRADDLQQALRRQGAGARQDDLLHEALLLAMEDGHVPAIALLITHGAKDPTGFMLLRAVEARQAEVAGALRGLYPGALLDRALMLAAEQGDVACVDTLVGTHNGLHARIVAMQTLAQQGAVEGVELLLDWVDRSHRTDPFLVAVEHGQYAVARCLMGHCDHAHVTELILEKALWKAANGLVAENEMALPDAWLQEVIRRAPEEDIPAVHREMVRRTLAAAMHERRSLGGAVEMEGEQVGRRRI
jgi:hypothetical protein